MRTFRKNSGGFTLTETTVSLLVLTILVSLTTGLIIMAGNVFSRNAARDRASSAGERLCGMIEEKLTCAVSLRVERGSGEEIPFDIPGEYTESLVIPEKGNALMILRKGQQAQTVLDEKALGGCTAEVSLKLRENGSPLLELTVKLSDEDGNCLFSKSSPLPLLNMTEENAGDFQVGNCEENGQPLMISFGYIQ